MTDGLRTYQSMSSPCAEQCGTMQWALTTKYSANSLVHACLSVGATTVKSSGSAEFCSQKSFTCINRRSNKRTERDFLLSKFADSLQKLGNARARRDGRRRRDARRNARFRLHFSLQHRPILKKERHKETAFFIRRLRFAF